MVPTATAGPPQATPADTVDAIVQASKRHADFPLRREFLQQRSDGVVTPGPFATLVRAGDRRGLLLYLLLVTKASGTPYDSKLPATVWARALGLPLPGSNTARSTISKAWLRLANLQLVRRGREKRMAKITLRREDGHGGDYDGPDADDDYFKVPLAFWLKGPATGDSRWYQLLSIPEIAVLLIGRSLGDAFRLPAEQGPDWYGISADTIARGVAGLEKKGLLVVAKRFKPAPLAPEGYTAENRYTLQAPFKVGRLSGHRVQRPTKKAAPKKRPGTNGPSGRRTS